MSSRPASGADPWVRVACGLAAAFFAYQLLVAAEGVVGTALSVITVLVLGSTLALLCQPLVEVGLKAHLPRPLAAAIALGLAIGIAALTLPPTLAQLRLIGNQAPHLYERAQDSLLALLSGYGVHPPRLQLEQAVGQSSPQLTQIALLGAGHVVQGFGTIAFSLAVAFWILADGPRLRAGAVNWAPPKLKMHLQFFLDTYSVVVGGYWRAQIVLVSVVGLLAGIGALVLGVPYPLVVGLAAGAFELVPIVGPFLGGAVAVLLAFSVSPLLAVVTIGLFLLIHLAEGYVLAPRIHGHYVAIHPLVALLAIYTGAELGGVLGALIAVPGSSLATVIGRALWADWLGRGEAADSAEGRRQQILAEFKRQTRSPWRRWGR